MHKTSRLAEDMRAINPLVMELVMLYKTLLDVTVVIKKKSGGKKKENIKNKEEEIKIISIYLLVIT